MSVNILVERNNFSQKSEGEMPHEQHKSTTRTKQIPFYLAMCFQPSDCIGDLKIQEARGTIVWVKVHLRHEFWGES